MSPEEAEVVYTARLAGLPVDPADMAAARAVVEEIKAATAARFRAELES